MNVKEKRILLLASGFFAGYLVTEIYVRLKEIKREGADAERQKNNRRNRVPNPSEGIMDDPAHSSGIHTGG